MFPEFTRADTVTHVGIRRRLEASQAMANDRVQRHLTPGASWVVDAEVSVLEVPHA